MLGLWWPSATSCLCALLACTVTTWSPLCVTYVCEDVVFGLVHRGAPGAPPVPGTERVLTSRVLSGETDDLRYESPSSIEALVG